MDNRIPLLLLPGLLNDAGLWRAQLDDLQDIAACQVGDQTRHDTLEEVAAAILSEAPPRFALAGFSLGGFVAQQILRMQPERVTRLALLDTSIHADSPERAAQRQQQRSSVRLPGAFNGFGDRLMRSYIDASRYEDAALIAEVRAMTARLGVDVFLRQSALARVDGSAVIAAWRRPLLVLCGANDQITPVAVHREIAALVPQATLQILPACGHLAPLERPDDVSGAMRRWLLAPDDGT